MKSLLIVAILLLPNIVLAHSGHDHADGLHQGIAILAGVLIVSALLGAAYLTQKRRQTKKE